MAYDADDKSYMTDNYSVPYTTTPSRLKANNPTNTSHKHKNHDTLPT